MVPAEDGSGVGAALIAALTLNVRFYSFTYFYLLHWLTLHILYYRESSKASTPVSTSNARTHLFLQFDCRCRANLDGKERQENGPGIQEGPVLFLAYYSCFLFLFFYESFVEMG